MPWLCLPAWRLPDSAKLSGCYPVMKWFFWVRTKGYFLTYTYYVQRGLLLRRLKVVVNYIEGAITQPILQSDQ